MSFLFDMFGGRDQPQPMALPADPSASEAARAEREAASTAAIAASKAAGRASTIVAGQQIAGDEQLLRATKRKAASQAMLG